MRLGLFAVSALLLAAVGCRGAGGSGPVRRPGATPPRTVEPGPRPSRDPCGLGPGGLVRRGSLAAVLKRGPGWLLSRLQLTRYPPRGRGRFLGWRVQEVRDRCLGRVLRAGDVVLSVDGMPLERPGDLWELWRHLEQVRRFHVDLIRSGRRERLRFRVQ